VLISAVDQSGLSRPGALPNNSAGLKHYFAKPPYHTRQHFVNLTFLHHSRQWSRLFHRLLDAYVSGPLSGSWSDSGSKPRRDELTRRHRSTSLSYCYKWFIFNCHWLVLVREKWGLTCFRGGYAFQTFECWGRSFSVGATSNIPAWPDFKENFPIFFDGFPDLCFFLLYSFVFTLLLCLYYILLYIIYFEYLESAWLAKS